MAYSVGLYPIVEKINLAKNMYSYWVHCPEVARVAQPGQFAHIKVDGFSLRRPISICEIDKEQGNIRVVFEIRGKGTEKMAFLNEKDNMDFIAPLGNGFSLLSPNKRVVVVGGGIGVPPLLETAKQYGQNAAAFLGFRSADAVILESDFINYHVHTTICTEDGTKGERGFVTTALQSYLEKKPVDMLYTCGPLPMLKAVVQLAEAYQIACEVSLEERMGCGVGACLVCACKTQKNGKEAMSHVCKDGPVFSAEEVVF